MPRYLADTSIWAWSTKSDRPDIAEKLAFRLERDEICTCVPVALEVLHRADSPARYEELFEALLAPLAWVASSARAERRALDVQRQLAAVAHGNHRRPAVDFLIAAAAETADSDVTLWFFDRDLRVICEQTGQPHEAESSGA